MIRSVLAVLAGIAVLTITSFAIEWVTNPLLLKLFPHALPNDAALNASVPAKLIMMAYTFLCVAAGGYVTAWMASRAKVAHAVIMGAIQMVMTVGVMLRWPHQTPLWSWVAGIVLIVPAAWWGGVIYANRSRRTATSAPTAAN
jgi:hypothetical protein